MKFKHHTIKSTTVSVYSVPSQSPGERLALAGGARRPYISNYIEYIL